jgi:hypothetical protein
MSGLQLVTALGQKLPMTSLAQIEASTRSASGGIASGQVGGGGVTGATALYGQGAAAGGSPTAYGYLGGPSSYATLAGQAGGLTSGFYSGANNLLGSGVPNALNVGASALNSSFGNQMQIANFEQRQQEALWGGLGKLAGGLGSAAIMASDRRLKEDIEVVGRLGALQLHTYRYRDDPSGDRYIGYMADEVEKLDPGAVVTTRDGYKAVDYNRATISALGG